MLALVPKNAFLLSLKNCFNCLANRKIKEIEQEVKFQDMKLREPTGSF